MKNGILVLLVLIISLGTATDSMAQFKAGFKAGYTGATLGGLKDQRNVKEVKTLTGYHAGFFGQFNVIFLTFQLDAVLNTQGAKWIDSGNQEHKYENMYLNLPLVAKFNLGPIFVLSGLQYGMQLSSKIDGIKDDSNLYFKKTDLAIPIGVGAGIKKIMVEARYNLGFTNVNNLPSNPDMTNACLQISAGLKF